MKFYLFEKNSGRQGQTHMSIVIIKSKDSTNNAGYMISYIAEDSKHVIYLPIAQKIINSFEFIG